jgi:hypothetical protein
LRRRIAVVHRTAEKPYEGPDPIVGKPEPRRGGRGSVEFDGKPLAQHRKIEGQGGIPHEARVGAVAPYFHAGGREEHVPRHIADRARLVLSETRLAGGSGLVQKNIKAGFILVAKMVGHPSRAMEFADIDAHAIPFAPRRRQAQHILR